MKLKLALATATAIGLLMGAAMAQENSTRVIQTGDENEATVTQREGGNNSAGNRTYVDWSLNQNGDNNMLDILQDGARNEIGTSNNLGGIGTSYGFNGVPVAQRPASAWTRNIGIDQVGDRNVLDITQTGDRNAVGAVYQEGSTTATATTNKLTIVQVGIAGTSHQGIGDVWQENTGGAANEASISQTGGGHHLGSKVYLVTQKGFANDLNIVQTGNSHVVTSTNQHGEGNIADIDQTGGTGNWVGSLDQDGSANYASILQNGSGNVVVSVSQDNTASSSFGNEAILTFNGSYNGVGTFTGDAAGLNLALATVSQLGDKNLVNYTVTGNNNLFAFSQTGDGNTSVGVVTGNNNQAAVKQTGDNNHAPFTQIGNYNIVAISQ